MNPSIEHLKTLSDSVFAFSGIIDSDGRVEAIGGDGFGKELNRLIGKHFLKLDLWQLDESNHNAISDAYGKALEGKSSNTRVRYKAGKETVNHIELTLLANLYRENTIFFGARDISNYQLELDEYKDRCDQYLFAAEGAKIGLWYSGFNSEKIFSTPTCNELFDYPKDDSLNFKDILDRVHPEDRKNIEEAFTESLDSKSEFNIKYRIIRKDGNIFWVSSRGKTFFSDSGNPKGMVGCVQNINEEKAVTEEMESIYNREKEARDEAELANNTKDFFIAVVSHELRSPLNSILGWTNILLKGDVDKKTQKKALLTIKRSGKSQAQLIEDLLDTARVTSGKLKLDLAPVNLIRIIRDVINSHIPAAEKKNVDIKYTHEIKIAEVFGDARRLKQVFSNILGNAVKFTPKNGSISVNLSAVGYEFEIKIKDTGRGINKVDIPYIFQQYMQGEEGASRKDKGLGLGLSLARILVEKHNGAIGVESDGADKGSEFKVTLPVLDEGLIRSFEEDIEDEPLENTSRRVLEDKVVLIVEDDEDSRNVLEIFIDQLGAETFTAESVRCALTWLTSSESQKPDIIISDIGMPDEDGYSFVKKLRASSEFKDIPAIALSAYTAEKNKAKAFKSGFQKYHTKPFVPELLSEEICELVFPDDQ